MEVDLAAAEAAKGERRERAAVENISGLGVRVLARVPWHLGEIVEVTPAVGEAALKAEVVYCQKQGNDRFVVGLKFRRSPVLRSILEKLKNWSARKNFATGSERGVRDFYACAEHKKR